MKRKKLSDMTPIERVEETMRNFSWDEAEDVGVEILARCMAMHVYARKQGKEYFNDLMKRICKRADAWAHEDNNPFILAMISTFGNKEKEDKV